MVKQTREIIFEIPFEFFLANDAKDFEQLIEWLITSKLNMDMPDDYLWKVKGVRYDKHDGILLTH